MRDISPSVAALTGICCQSLPSVQPYYPHTICFSFTCYFILDISIAVGKSLSDPTRFIEETKSCCHKIPLCPVLANTKDRWLRNASVKNEGDNDENRSDRRYWTHRLEACEQAS